jgi:integrase
MQRRVYGPYEEPDGSWRLVVIDERTRTARRYPTKEEAERDRDQLRAHAAELAATAIEDAILRYKLHKRREGNKERTLDTTTYRLEAFFKGALEDPVERLTPARCKALYDDLKGRQRNDTHRNTLGQVKTFLRWCVAEKLLRASPAEGLRGEGRRSRGKAQLRVSEARRWFEAARALMEQGEAGAVAAAVALLLGPRGSEVTGRVARDLDDEGRLLWIEDAKTASGDRCLEVPDVLRPYLLRLAEGKGPTDPLFPCQGRAWVLAWTKRICQAAGVPVVTAHSLRGLHATLSEACGVTAHVVAQALGHASPEITRAHYTQPAAVDAARQERVLRVLEGGRRSS